MFCFCRQHFSQQLPPCLLIALLSSRSADAVSLSLDALLGVARLLPGLLPVQAAARLLELLCSNMHGEQQQDPLLLRCSSCCTLARLVPGLLPVQAAARLLELLCSSAHGEQQQEWCHNSVVAAARALKLVLVAYCSSTAVCHALLVVLSASACQFLHVATYAQKFKSAAAVLLQVLWQLGC